MAALAALATAALLTACGGGGGAGGQGGSGGAGGSPEVASIELTTSAPSIGSDGRTEPTITAFVKDSANRAMPNQQVEFSTTDAGASLAVVSGRTDANGLATARLRITDKTNRTITVSALTGSLSRSVDVAVVGTTLTVNGPSSVVLGAATEFTVALRDSAGAVLDGRPWTVVSAAGNAVQRLRETTDSAGQAKFVFTGTLAGPDTLSVTALGATASVAVRVASTQLSFLAPAGASSPEVPVLTPQDVSVRFTLNGQPQAGQLVQFTATRGVLSPSSAVTDAAGTATVRIESANAGLSTITALAGGVSSSQGVEFVSRVPVKLALQASPANVGVNLTPESSNSSQLIAVVRDAADNPVKGQTVSFSAVTDPSNGRIEPGIATTDSSGVATVAFFPGANSSGFNQVRIRAAVPGTGVVGETTLTASRQELVVRVGTGNTIEEPDISTYSMPWTAVVTDASGNPVVGAVVQPSLVALRFDKGTYVPGPDSWVRDVTASCISEDINDGPGSGNLRLDAGEDTNGDGQLTPGTVASTVVVSEGGRTDANGIATIRVNYPQDFGGWVHMQLRVTITTIAGTEGVAQRDFLLPVSASDLTADVPPPGTPSPFGLIGDCRSPL